MTTDNREAIKALVAEWRADHRDYPESKQDCADELEALLTTEPPAEGGVPELGDEAVQRAAKAIADVVGHGMAEKCEAQARAAFTAAGAAQGGGEAVPFDAGLREFLGKLVRMEWVAWAKEQPAPKPSWLVEWDRLPEPDREVDRRIGERVWNTAVGHLHAPAPTPAAQPSDAVADRNAIRVLRSEVSGTYAGHDIVQGALAHVEARLASSAPAAVTDRDAGGRIVREAWVRWARTQPNPKPSWLVPYDDLSEPDKEADRQIFEACAATPAAVGGDAANAARYRWLRSSAVGMNRLDRILFETVNDDCNPPYRSLKHGADLDAALDAAIAAEQGDAR